METLFTASYIPNSSWFTKQNKSTRWTKEENKRFESALALYDEKTPNRWFKVAALIPGKSVLDVINQYEELVADVSNIEAGLVPIPGYLASSFTLELVDDRGFNYTIRKRSRSSDQERKKGVPWTEEEHRRFLMGLQKYGRGDWRNISRKFVISKTPTQVASHAQKYYLRQHSGGKDKRRPSIHDITVVSLTGDAPVDNTKSLPQQKSSAHLQDKTLPNWNQSNNAAFMALGSTHCNSLAVYPPDIASTGGFGTDIGIQATRYQIHG